MEGPGAVLVTVGEGRRTMDTEPQQTQWDVIVVGTGMGGAALGHAMAECGRRVLFCEMGQNTLPENPALRGQYPEMLVRNEDPKEHEALFQSGGRWTEPLLDLSEKHTQQHVPFLGAGTGGSTSLYGAALERFFPEDFRPGEFHGSNPESNLPLAWPIDFESLLPYYQQAESLFHVHGEPDRLRPDRGTFKFRVPPPLSLANCVLRDHLSNRGLHPYRLPLGAEFTPACTTCQGFLCSNNCKNDSTKVFLQPSLQQYGAKLLDDCRVVRLEADRQRVTSVKCIWQGKPISLTGETIVLAAGALATPLILLGSGSRYWPDGLANGSGMVGRNLMRHFVDLYALFPRERPQPDENTKELAFNDFYLKNGLKLGGVQSFGWLPPAEMLTNDIQRQIRESRLAIAAPVFGIVKPAVRWLLGRSLCRALVLATTLEDLPYPDNRVFRDPQGRMALRYHINTDAHMRIRAFRQSMKEVLNGWRYLLIRQAENNERLAHACGTCKMGDDPGTSVVNGHNRAHELENLYIVDASFFPSSGGTNPSLTIAANALRVADHLREY